MEIPGLFVVERHVMCLIAKNLANLVPVGFTISGTHIPETTRQIVFVQSSMKLSRPAVVQSQEHLPINLIWPRPWAIYMVQMIGQFGMDVSETAPISSKFD